MISSIARASFRRSAVQARSTTVRRMGGGHFAPVTQNHKAKLFEGHPTNEGWEWTIGWWYTTSFIMIVGILGFTPNTDITAWARQEAEARLKLKEAGFEDFVFGTHYQDLSVEEAKEVWDKFSAKSMRMNDEDDDEEDEEEEDDDDDE